MIVRRVLSLLALAACLACNNPAGPSSIGLRVRYQPPPVPPGQPNPIISVACSHHYAPANLEVSTSWGASERLIPAPGGGGLTANFEVDASGDYWVSIVDITFCGFGDVDTPSPPSGVSINSVVLTRTAILGGRRVFLFSAARGKIVS